GGGEPARELMRELQRERHELRRFVRRVPEHDALVAGAARVDAHGDVAGLFADELDDLHAVGVERLGGVRIADLADGAPRDGLILDVCIGTDLAGEHDLSGLAQHLARDAAAGIALEMCVEDGISDVIADLVRMAFADGLRCERVATHENSAPTALWEGNRKARNLGSRAVGRRHDLDGYVRDALRVAVRGPSNRGNRRALTR